MRDNSDKFTSRRKSGEVQLDEGFTKNQWRPGHIAFVTNPIFPLHMFHSI